MIRRLLLLTLVVCVPSAVFAQAKPDALAKQLEANERAINVAIQKGDLAVFHQETMPTPPPPTAKK